MFRNCLLKCLEYLICTLDLALYSVFFLRAPRFSWLCHEWPVRVFSFFFVKQQVILLHNTRTEQRKGTCHLRDSLWLKPLFVFGYFCPCCCPVPPREGALLKTVLKSQHLVPRLGAHCLSRTSTSWKLNNGSRGRIALVTKNILKIRTNNTLLPGTIVAYVSVNVLSFRLEVLAQNPDTERPVALAPNLDMKKEFPRFFPWPAHMPD